jgi:hypothetical protein
MRGVVLLLGACGRIGFAPQDQVPDDGVVNNDAIGPTDDAPLNAVVVTFGNRADAMVRDVVRDTFILEAQQTLNHGIRRELEIDTGDDRAHALIRVDVSSIPASATVFSAVLELKVTNPSESATLSGFRVLEDWDEGVGDGQGGAASWVSRTIPLLWSGPGATGASRDATLIAQVSGAFADDTVIPIDLAPVAVQGWVVDPPNNFGFVLEQTLGINGVDFGSSEESRDDYRPLLTVTYVP